MNRYGSTANSIASQVARAADEFLDELGRGDDPNISDFAQRFPEIASVLPEILPVLRMMHAPRTSGEQPASPFALPLVLGDFRLLREIGRGGMGVVYEAEQISAGRPVAVKVLAPTPGLDARQCARFQIEAQVAAALHHPHIVPIYAVGHDLGLHYHAMQLIHGRCLAEILRGPESIENRCDDSRKGTTRAIPPIEAARLAMQAAEALEHAHELGVVHRDIKPANLLRDDDGHLWITDFGVASFPGGTELTQSGDLIGTVRYMSPEQASGRRILDPRTDVYSLGATLYELLTARPAFSSTYRNEILYQIAAVEPVPVRKLDPSIPRDLETIVAKAMAKEPEGRYGSAQALADDLRRFLEDRPIVATRPGIAERAARWSRRHRRTTAAAALSTIIVALALAAGMARLWREQQHTQSALSAAMQAKARERQALIFTFTASDQITSRALALISAMPRGEMHALAIEHQEFCRKALAYYEEIGARYDGDAEMRAIAAAALHRVGFVRTILKDERGSDALLRSIAMYEQLIAEMPQSHDLRSELALTLGDLVVWYQSAGDPTAVIGAIERVVAIRQGMATDFPDDTDNPVSLIYHQLDLAARLEAAGRSADAEIVHRQLLRGSDRALECKRGDHRLRNNLAWLFVKPANVSQEIALKAIALAGEATALKPEIGGYWNTMAWAQFRAGRFKEAIEAAERSMQLRAGGDPYDWLVMAMAKWRMGEPRQVLTWYARSTEWISANAPHDQELARFLAEAARLVK